VEQIGDLAAQRASIEALSIRAIPSASERRVACVRIASTRCQSSRVRERRDGARWPGDMSRRRWKSWPTLYARSKVPRVPRARRKKTPRFRTPWNPWNVRNLYAKAACPRVGHGRATTGDEVVVEGRRTAKARSEEAGYPGTNQSSLCVS
jgi:hypothetical protein